MASRFISAYCPAIPFAIQVFETTLLAYLATQPEKAVSLAGEYADQESRECQPQFL